MRLDTHRLALLLALAPLAACESDDLGPGVEAQLAFDQEALGLGQARSATLVVRNTGSTAAGPIDVVAGPVQKAGIEIPGVTISADPEEIPTLNPGDSVVIELAVAGDGGLQAGSYSAELSARVQQSRVADATISFDVLLPAGEVGAVEIGDVPTEMRQGDVIDLAAVVYDTLGAVLELAPVTWSTLPMGAGLVTADGEYVPYAAGDVRLIARAGDRADTLEVAVAARNTPGSFTVVGNGAVMTRFTSDVWVHGTHAITGTWGFRGALGDAVLVWDISGATPVLTDSVLIEARTVDDVMIRADGQLAVATHEYMSTEHAISLLDMSDPAHPTVAGEYHSDEPTDWIGVHNAWLDGDHAYIVVDGVAENRGLWILDVSDPANPVRVARFYGGSSFLHDVIVRDGLAFLSHWNAGLIILDVGNGMRGGSPSNPVEVSRIVTFGGEVHNAWYWPERGYVFVGEEDFATPGRLHVVDVSDIEHPVEVASFRMIGDTPHNYWMDEENEILYTSWYSRGIQAVDVSGELRGSLELQGRTIASLEYAGPGSPAECPGYTAGENTCAWGPQLHSDGFLYVADMNSGIWKLQPNIP